MGVGGAVVGSHAAETPSGHPRPRRHHPRAAWIDGDGAQLCYMYGGHKYNYEITDGRRRQNYSSPTCNKDSVLWDNQLRLSPVKARWWDIFCGYRPNLLSPHDIAAAPKLEEEQSEHRLVRELQCHKPSNKRRRSPSLSRGNA
ncbi:hypothetical protein ZWY2020_015202 [Hordeum vulgare]|nr:hypothetical protein ZWY2020_015202 [Hordeum vulgare]